MRRLMVLLVVAFALGSGTAFAQESTPTPSPSVPSATVDPAEIDDLWATIDALEKRIDDLEAQVADLQAQIDQEGSGGSQNLAGPTHTIIIELAITGIQNIATVSMTNCGGSGGYDDLFIGTAVTVRDGDDAIIANGSFTTAKRTDGLCTLTATIENVPEVPFYQFEISHRGAPSYSLADMKASDWTVSLSIGD